MMKVAEVVVKRVLLATLLAAGVLGAPARAHHSFVAIYDAAKPVSVAGTVSLVEWTNPHARVYVDAKNDNGGVDTWEFELASPNGLMRIGWTRKSLNPGEEVTVEGILARDGSKRANARSITRADGTKMFMGDPVQGGLN